MSCARDLLLTRDIDDPELLAHLPDCPTCGADHPRLRALLPQFHDELTAFEPQPLPSPPTRFSMPAISTVLLAAASLGVITLAATKSEPPAVPTIEQASALRMDASRAKTTRMIPWNALSEKEWAEIAQELLPDAKIAVQQQLDTEDALLVLIETGRAAENANQGLAPFYGQRQDTPVNVYFYEASRLVKRRPELLEKVENNDQKQVLMSLLERLP